MNMTGRDSGGALSGNHPSKKSELTFSDVEEKDYISSMNETLLQKKLQEEREKLLRLEWPSREERVAQERKVIRLLKALRRSK